MTTENEKLPALPAIPRETPCSGTYPMRFDKTGEYVGYDEHVAAMHAYATQAVSEALARDRAALVVAGLLGYALGVFL